MMPFLAIVDVETTGLDPLRHEIIDIGMVLLSQETGETLDVFSSKIFPQALENADPQALKVNGFSQDEWHGAPLLSDVLPLFSEKAKGSLLLAYNVTFDWSFLQRAFLNEKLPLPFNYHRLDLLTLAWAALVPRGLSSLRLSSVAQFLGSEEEPLPHRALAGAQCAAEVYRRLRKMYN